MRGGLIKEKSWLKNDLSHTPFGKPTGQFTKHPSYGKQTSKRILLGEKQYLLQKVYCACLEQSGYIINTVTQGQHLLELYYSQPYALLILGSDLLDMTCLAIAKSIRTHEQIKGLAPIPILLLAEASFEQIKKDCERLNINDFLIKPVRLSELQAIVQRWLVCNLMDKPILLNEVSDEN